jgi:FkbM family methyltransferase
MLLSTIVKHGRTLRNLCYVREYQAAATMAEWRLTPTAVVYSRETRSYWVPELEINLGPAHHGLLAALWQALALKRAGVRFSNSGSEIIAHASGFNVAVENEEELFILREVVANGAYNVVPSAPGAVVLDIGMNVGYASLQFAAQPWVAAVWSYEPVPATYARALRNLERNPQLAARIEPHNYGLTDAGGQMTFDYSPRWRGAAGVQGLSAEFRSYHGVKEDDVSRVTIEVRSASETVREVRRAFPAAEVIVKLDSEGCEYPIIADLQRTGLLRHVDVFLIEWHKRGAGELLEALAAGGFCALSLTPQESTGMIYACRRGGM